MMCPQSITSRGKECLFPITGDINFDYLATVVSARFLHFQGIISPFVIFNLVKKKPNGVIFVFQTYYCATFSIFPQSPL